MGKFRELVLSAGLAAGQILAQESKTAAKPLQAPLLSQQSKSPIDLDKLKELYGEDIGADGIDANLRAIAREEAPELYQLLDKMHARYQDLVQGKPFPKPVLVTYNQDFIMGSSVKPGVVNAEGVTCLSSGLLKKWDIRKQAAVVAHELAHQLIGVKPDLILDPRFKPDMDTLVNYFEASEASCKADAEKCPEPARKNNQLLELGVDALAMHLSCDIEGYKSMLNAMRADDVKPAEVDEVVNRAAESISKRDGKSLTPAQMARLRSQATDILLKATDDDFSKDHPPSIIRASIKINGGGCAR